MSHVLAIDIGSSSVRTALFDTRGSLLPDTLVQFDHDLTVVPGGIAQVDADRVRITVERAIDQTLQSRDARHLTIAVVGITTFWHSLVALDAQGKPLTPVFTWADTRSAAEADDLRQRLDANAVHQRTGCRIHPSYLPAKIAWLRRHDPAVFVRATLLISLAQYLSSVWLGTTDTSVSMASGSGLLDNVSCEWDQELVSVLGINAANLGRILPSSELLPPLQKEYALRWPALAGVPWRAAIGDGAASNVGIGCVTSDRLSLMVGTSGAMRRCEQGDPARPLHPGLWRYRLDRRHTLVGGALSEGGNVYAWLRETLNLPSPEECEAALAAREPAQHGLVVLPLWSGERSLGWVGNATAVITGLKQHTAPLDILQASLEGVAYRFALLYDALRANGERVVATGGGLRSSPVWLQIMADALGVEVEHSAVAESSLRGAALIALRDVNLMDPADIQASPVQRVYQPRPHAHAQHRQAIERQRTLYDREIGPDGDHLLARQTR
jgi:gluconokinase